MLQGRAALMLIPPDHEVPRIGMLWDLLPIDWRLAVCAIQPHGDLSYLLDSTWKELSERDRECLMVGFRRLRGLGQLADLSLP